MAYYRYRLRYGSSRLSQREKLALAAVAFVLLAGAGHTAAAAAHGSTPAAAPGAATAIAYAKAQLGCPYQWGGTGPCDDGYDCSGLVMQAWAAAGVTIPRTSEEQWAGLPHIPASQIRPGDLVFFPGGDGTWAEPGHVAMVISGGRMIQAYSTGYPLMISPLNGDGAGGIVGYARP